MSATLAFLALLAVTIAWALLPFVPAVRELLAPTDARPLDMVGRDSGDITHFATGFRAYLARHPALGAPARDDAAASDAASAGGDVRGALDDGTPYVRVATAAGWPLVAPAGRGTSDALVVLDAPVPVPAGLALTAETYARAELDGGSDVIYRAILADGQCTLGARSTVLRWAHARGPLHVAEGSRLFGRASSDDRIELRPDVAFERLGAPAIFVGASPAPRVDVGPGASATMTPYHVEGAVDLGHRNYRVDGDLELPAGAWVVGNYVARGDVRVAAGTRVEGSVKAHGDLTVAAGATIARAAVARGSVRLGAGCRVGGPLIAEDDAIVGAGSWVGLPQRPTTIAARRVTLASGTRVFGRVSTTEGGATIA